MVRRARVDKLLVERGLAGSRERAQRLIMAGEIWIADRRVDKPGALIPLDAPLEVRGADIPFVSRGGLKLDAALGHWSISVTDCMAIDIGASTGGFTDCLLQRGACHVFAVDVGYGQLAWPLRQDPRVTLFERTNIRTLDASRFPRLADLAVIDVSFISLRLVLPTVVKLVRQQGTLLALIKPQFEVGKGEVGKGGVVRDPTQHRSVVDTIRTFAESVGFVTHGEYASPILGPKGNREFFLYCTVVPARDSSPE